MLELKSGTFWSASLSNIALNVAFKMLDFALSSVYIIRFAALNGETPTVSCLLLLISCQNFFGFTFKSRATMLLTYVLYALLQTFFLLLLQCF